MRLGSDSIVRQLVGRDALVACSRDDKGVSAILRCLYDWNLELLEILLATSPGLDIFEAAALGKVKRLEELLASAPDLVHAWSPDGVTALHLACFYGQEEAVRCLLRAGADPVARARDERGSTPFQEATSTGQLNIVHLLLAHGAEAHVPRDQDWDALPMAGSQA
jgi:ankyrin repeat protein